MKRVLAAYTSLTRRMFGPAAPAEGWDGGTLAPYLLLFAALAMLVVHAAPFCLSHNADAILPGIMSVQKVTLFYWGQNRLASLLPALTAWIPDIQVNYAAQVFLRCFGAFSIPWFVIQLLRPIAYAPLAYTIGVAATFMLLTTGSIQDLFLGGQPYGTAALLAGLALYLGSLRPAQVSVRLARSGLEFLLLSASFLVNPSLVIVLGGYVALSLLTCPSRRQLRRLVVVATAFAGCLVLTKLEGPTETYMSFSVDGAALTSVLASLQRGASMELLLLLLVAVALSLTPLQMQHFRRRMRAGVEPADSGVLAPLVRKSGQLLAACLTYVVVISLSDHVRLNGYAPRYYTAVLAMLATLAGILVAALFEALRQSPALGRRPAQLSARRTAVAYATCLAACAIALSTKVERHFACALPGLQRQADTEVLAQVAAAHGVSFVSGDYWSAWPVVYATISDRGAAGSRPPVFGLAPRGQVMLREIEQYLATTERVAILCIGSKPPDCYLPGRWIDSTLWPPAAAIAEAGTLPGGEIYSVVILARDDLDLRLQRVAAPASALLLQQTVANGARRAGTTVIVPAGEDRIVLFGPYISLPPGRSYELRLQLASIEEGDGGRLLTADVVNRAGADVHFRRRFATSDFTVDAGGTWIVMKFALPMDPERTDALEFRIWAASGAAFEVRELALSLAEP